MTPLQELKEENRKANLRLQVKITALLESKPNLSASQIVDNLCEPDAFVYGALASMIRNLKIHISGEVKSKARNQYLPKYSLGMSGEFTPAPRIRKPRKKMPDRLKPKKADIVQTVAPFVAEAAPKVPPQSWMSALDMEPVPLKELTPRQIRSRENYLASVRKPRTSDSPWEAKGILIET